MLYQANLSIIDLSNNNQLTDKYTAPGGHGQWGVRLLHGALTFDVSQDDKTYIRAFYNGDGIANFPDASIIGWMAKEKAAIVMISTTKAGLDKKGGQIGIQKFSDGTKDRVQMLELAQAKKLSKEHEELFYSIGLSGKEMVAGVDKDGNPCEYTNQAGKQFFNTNIALINYTILAPILQELTLLDEVEFEGKPLSGKDLVERIITPDLIENVKDKDDGKKYTQLEGAIGSALLNLNAFFTTSKDPGVKAILEWHDIDRLLRIVNVGIDKRTRFFTPVKFSWDYWFLAYSDFYELDARNWSLINTEKGKTPPALNIITIYKKDKEGNLILDKEGNPQEEKFYQDVHNCIDCFGNTSAKYLTSLTIEGKVAFKDAILKGEVTIISECPDVVNLNTKEARDILEQDVNEPLVLDNVKINISKEGKVSVASSSLIKRLSSWISGHEQAFCQALSSQDKEAIEQLANRVNLHKGAIDALDLPDIAYTDEFIKSNLYSEYREKAIKALLKGQYSAECFFAGAATRLGKGPMWNVEFWEIAQEQGKKIPSYANRTLKLGERQLIQLYRFYEELAKKHNLKPEEIIAKQIILLHINTDIEKDVIKDLTRNNHYGFNPENVLIIVQPTLPLYTVNKEGKVIEAPTEERYVYGHGYATEQLKDKRSAYIVKDGRKETIYESALEYIKQRGVKYIGTHRINDLTRLLLNQKIGNLTYSIIDIDKLALSVHLIDMGYNVVVEVVENTTGQKGGLLIKDTKTQRNFLLEGLAAKNKDLDDRLGQLNQKAKKELGAYIPYNAFRLVYDVNQLENILTQGLRNSIRTRTTKDNKSYIQLELVTGDITQAESAKAIGLAKKKEQIHDFKALKNVDEGVAFVGEMDRGVMKAIKREVESLSQNIEGQGANNYLLYIASQNTYAQLKALIYDNKTNALRVVNREFMTISYKTKEDIFGILTKLWDAQYARSEERRVGKECRSRWSPYH